MAGKTSNASGIIYEWQKLLLLEFQGCWDYIDGLIPAPDFHKELEKYQKWRQTNAKIVSAILNSVES